MGGLHAAAERRGNQEGKLIAAVRLWAGGDAAQRRRRFTPRPDLDELADLTGGEAAPAAAPDEEEDTPTLFRVWAPVWAVFDLFLMAERIWRYPPLGGPPLGLDWTQLESLARGLSVAWTRETIVMVRAMEDEAARIWTDEWKRKNPPKGT